MRYLKLLILSLCFVLISIGYFSYMQNSAYVYDENMYITAGVLIQKLKLYTDFTYYQMPYQPIIFGLIFKLAGTSYYFMGGRVINFIFLLFSIFLIYILTMKLTKSFLISLLFMLIFCFNGIIIWTSSYINNSVIPIFFTLLGLYSFLSTNEDNKIEKIDFFKLFLSGLFLAFATGIKIYYGFLLLPFLITALFFPLSLNKKVKFKKQFIPIIIGFLLGLVPVFYYLLTDFDAFVFNNIRYHSLNTIWWKIARNEDITSTIYKIKYFINVILSESNIMIFVSFFYLLAVILYDFIKGNYNNKKFSINREMFLLIILVILSIFAALLPSPLWIHYFALPLPFAILFMSYLTNHFSSKSKMVALTFLALFTLSTIYFNSSNLFAYYKNINCPEKWLTIKVHKTARTVGSLLSKKGLKGKIATFHPIFSLEADYDIYKEFSSTIFSIRIGGLINEYERIKYKIPTFGKLDQLFYNEKPTAFFIGGISGFDNSLLEYAKSKGYYRLTENSDLLDIYIK